MSGTQTMFILNVKHICRCCHAYGSFKSLKKPYKLRGKVEVYFEMLIETFGLLINPPTKEASYQICDGCIIRLKDATKFRHQVEACEEKFNEYYSRLLQKSVVQTDNRVISAVELQHKNDSVGNVDGEFKNENTYICGTNVEYKHGSGKEEDNELDNVKYEDGNISEDTDDEIKNLDDDYNSVENITESSVDPLMKLSTKIKNEKVFDCDLCQIKFISKAVLRMHIKEHMNKKYKCSDCGPCYTSLRRLKIHYMNVHNKTISCDEKVNSITDVQKVKLINYLECRFCKKGVRECHYDRHLKTHVGKTECIKCNKIFDTINMLKEHSKEHKDENMYTCDICKRRFIRRSTLKRHIDLHHMGKGRKLMCHECGVFFNDITNLRTHTTNVHQKLRMFECSICQKKLASKISLKVHIRTHTGERPYVCDECGEGFICFTKLKIHRIKHDTMKKYGTKYVCKICQAVFHGQGPLTRHVRSEHPGRSTLTTKKYTRKHFPCPSCKKVFSQKYSLDRHVAKHGDTVKVACEICNKMFTDKSSLSRHMRNIHTPKETVIKQKVQCSLCKRKVHNIQSHMTVHTVRPLRCETCGKNYPDAAVLHRHVMNVHHDVNKIFQCKKCDRRPYSRNENLRIHMLKKHDSDLKDDEEPFSELK